MGESVQTLASIEIDGRSLRCRHGVLIRSGEIPCDDWTVVMLDVAFSCEQLLRGDGRLLLRTADGFVATGRAEVDSRDRTLICARLNGVSTLRAIEVGEAAA